MPGSVWRSLYEPTYTARPRLARSAGSAAAVTSEAPIRFTSRTARQSACPASASRQSGETPEA